MYYAMDKRRNVIDFTMPISKTKCWVNMDALSTYYLLGERRNPRSELVFKE
jgi:hypothetical protein